MLRYSIHPFFYEEHSRIEYYVIGEPWIFGAAEEVSIPSTSKNFFTSKEQARQFVRDFINVYAL